MSASNTTTETVSVHAVKVDRRGSLTVAARGWGWPSESATEEALDTFLSALDSIEESGVLDTVEPGEKVGELTVESETREVIDFEINGMEVA